MTLAKTVAVAAGGLLFATAAFAQPPGGMRPGGMPGGPMGPPGMRGPPGPIANADPAALKGGAFTVDASHTRVLFSVSHMGFSTWYGDFTGVSGSLRLDPRDPAASRVDVSLPVDSVMTTNAKLDGELKGADWLGAAQFPTATFRSRETRMTGSGRADVMGELTLHGVTRPLTLHVKFNGAGANPMSHDYTAGFEARGMFKRSEFGVTRFVPVVGDEVELIISGAFVQKPA